MSRQIKFRGLSTNDGKWIYGDLVHNAFDGVRGIDLAIKEYGMVPVQINEGTEGQFTGLHDSKGNEIYFRSDKVRAVVYDDFTGEKTCLEGYLFIDYKRFKISLSGHEDFNLQYADELEIIGNIHQNKSLEDK
jgi:uncharacterized phage protein (TIGR01671 family)